MSRCHSLLFPLVAIVSLSISQPCWAVSLPPADIADWKLRFSNTFSSGGPWGDMQIAANNTGAAATFKDESGVTHTLQNGEVLLIWTAYSTPYSSTGQNFGFDKIAFNSFANLSKTGISIHVTGLNGVTWNVDTSNGATSEFGKFEYKYDAHGNNGSPGVTVDIIGLGSSATIQNFEKTSTGGGFMPAQYIAAHIKDFSQGNQSSQFVAGSPEPSSWILLGGIALVLLGYNYWLSSKRLWLSLTRVH